MFSPTGLPLKPEAPWIKRTEFGIKFTDEILKTEYEDFDVEIQDSDWKPAWFNPLIHPIEVKFSKKKAYSDS